MTKFKRLPMIAFSLIAVSFHPAIAADRADDMVVAGAGEGIVMFGGIGYTWLRGTELVYSSTGDRISQLDWETQAPALTGTLKAWLSDFWTVSGTATIGFSGDSHMEDRDWLTPFSPSFDFDDWSDLSVHPDTKLDRYIDLSIAVGRDFAISDNAVVNLHGGLKYTDVKWTAYGGSFVYSTNGFRDDVFSLVNGERNITFEQRYPGVFLGAETTVTGGRWAFTGLLRGGMTVGATDTDHHWLRDLRFEDKYGAISFLSLGARVDYSVLSETRVFLAANYDKYFRKVGNSDFYDINTGEHLGGEKKSAGAKFEAFTVSSGVRIAF